MDVIALRVSPGGGSAIQSHLAVFHDSQRDLAVPKPSGAQEPGPAFGWPISCVHRPHSSASHVSVN